MLHNHVEKFSFCSAFRARNKRIQFSSTNEKFEMKKQIQWKAEENLSFQIQSTFCIYFREEKLTNTKAFFAEGKLENAFESHWKKTVKKISRRLWTKKNQNTAKKTPMGKEWRQTASLQRKSHSVVKKLLENEFFSLRAFHLG